MSTSAMIDIETLDILPTAAIVSIGIVLFDGEEVRETYYWRVSLESCFDLGLTLSEATVKWWFKQSPEAQAELTNAKRIPLRLAVEMVNDQLQHVDRAVWSCGSFDLEILKNAFRACGVIPAWKYWQERDYRTLRQLRKWKLPERRSSVAHNALDDAGYQVMCLWAIEKQLEGVGCEK